MINTLKQMLQKIEVHVFLTLAAIYLGIHGLYRYSGIVSIHGKQRWW